MFSAVFVLHSQSYKLTLHPSSLSTTCTKLKIIGYINERPTCISPHIIVVAFARGLSVGSNCLISSHCKAFIDRAFLVVVDIIICKYSLDRDALLVKSLQCCNGRISMCGTVGLEPFLSHIKLGLTLLQSTCCHSRVVKVADPSLAASMVFVTFFAKVRPYGQL